VRVDTAAAPRYQGRRTTVGEVADEVGCSVADRPYPWIWLDGSWMPSSEASVGLFTHSLHYGTAVLDGCRARRVRSGRLAAFRLADHVSRFVASMRAMFMQTEHDEAELQAACIGTISRIGARTIARTGARTGADESYVRLLAWYGDEAIGIGAHNPTRVAVLAWPAPAPAPAPVRLRVAGFGHDARWLPGAKLAGQYARSFLARREAQATGCDDAVFLGPDGTVAEATGATLFVAHGSHLRTPTTAAPILRGITRDTLLVLARERGLHASEAPLRRDELLGASEAFLANSAQGVTPVGAIEGHPLPAPGPITRALAAAYQAAVTGEDAAHPAWLTEIA
jgi:branched-chain amino acid aminotransferase